MQHHALDRVAWLLAVCVVTNAHAQSPTDLDRLSVEELTRIEVPHSQQSNVSQEPVAKFVLTQDMIRRSGATTIPEALRLVPGLEVAQIDASRWAISMRGFNNRQSNKLLVKMDGRTLVTPAFGGVFWDAVDTSIQDIERIEVIRGPGSANADINAVNGTINIITKKVVQTAGTLLYTEKGMERPGSFSLRYGEANNPDAAWRVFAKFSKRAANVNARGEPTHDDWQQARLGARADFEFANGDELTTSFDAYTGHSGVEATALGALAQPAQASRDRLDGIAASTEWTRTLEDGGQLQVFGSLEHSDRSSASLAERRDVFDLQVQHVLPPTEHHALQWGATAHYTWDWVPSGAVLLVANRSRELGAYSLYAEDEFTPWDERFALVAGAKLDAATGGNTLLLPNLRARYTLDERTMVWAEVSQAARRPARFNDEVLNTFSVENIAFAPLQLTTLIEMRGEADSKPERVTSVEAGLRREWAPSLTSDISLFYSRYRDLTSFELDLPECRPSGVSVAINPLCVLASNALAVPVNLRDHAKARFWGGELQVIWTPVPQWRLVASLTYLQRDFTRAVEAAPLWAVLAPTLAPALGQDNYTIATGSDPRRQLALQSLWSLKPDWDWDIYVRHVSRTAPRSTAIDDFIGVPAYMELTSRIAWRPTREIEVALLGANLLHAHHREHVSEFADIVATEIERSVALQLRWAFQ